MATVLRRSPLLLRSGIAANLPRSSTPALHFVRTLKQVALLEQFEKPAPWPYEKKKYRWYHSVFNYDVTWKRIDENSKVILVEGNIGSGKTTFAKQLAEQLGMKYFPEACVQDLYEWLYGYDLREYDELLPPDVKHFEIQEFYENPHHKMVATFQIMKYMARYQQYQTALLHLFSTGQGVIMERSAFSDFVFVDAMAKHGYLSRNARRFYYDLKSNSIQDLMKPHCVIYLDAPVDVCMERIKQRNIPYEINSPVMTKEYLKSIERYYKQFYLKQMEPFVEQIIYDWSTPGDVETVVDDLQMVDFDRDRVYYDPKLREWRELTNDYDWDQARHRVTNWKFWAREVSFNIAEECGADELWIHEDQIGLWDQLERELKRINNKYYAPWWDVKGKIKKMFII